MRFLMAGVLATLTAAGLAAIRPPAPREDERIAAKAIREGGMRADIRFLSTDLVEGRGPASRGDALARAYIASRLEAIGLEPGAPGGTWEQPVEIAGATTTANVIGLLRGRDPELAREVVLYTARHDRCGASPAPSGNPVVDDGAPGSASGVAALLAIAEAYAALPIRPHRSILFAAVGDGGLPGPGLALPLPVPGGTLAASFDLDERSDVPSFAGPGLPEHRPGGWAAGRDLPGAVADAQSLFHVGLKVADAPLAPAPRRDGEIEAAGKPATPGNLR